MTVASPLRKEKFQKEESILIDYSRTAPASSCSLPFHKNFRSGMPSVLSRGHPIHQKTRAPRLESKDWKIAGGDAEEALPPGCFLGPVQENLWLPYMDAICSMRRDQATTGSIVPHQAFITTYITGTTKKALIFPLPENLRYLHLSSGRPLDLDFSFQSATFFRSLTGPLPIGDEAKGPLARTLLDKDYPY
ncbi:hypothetical protein MCOR02_011017 [Pyricularia oryzae]|nr:hypothetical protein MCOR02_011017 [Pyricularia oryzae]KAI6276027.1 hypothetical protein MCOR26_005772 [Pyricularia oryzae]KAI6341242.1 hypothetical protein MCOR28_006108 [Pyricularia oryzae]KAI6405111.1 hypothetical protein MCOR20_006663 [Pyricularia oryzae]KAI6427633.1 hypothetical protein MCOR21_006022 [Pyricularia oryzae]